MSEKELGETPVPARSARETAHDWLNRIRRPSARRVLGACGIALAASAGGVAGGTLASYMYPAEGNFYGFSTESSLDLNPFHTNEINLRTGAGQVDAHFNSRFIAPGIRVQTEITPEVINTLSDPSIIKTLTSSPDSLKQEANVFVRAQAEQLAVPLAIGGSIGGFATGLIAYSLLKDKEKENKSKMRHLTTVVAIGAMSAGAGAISTPALAYQAYHNTAKASEVKATGFISNALKTSDILKFASSQQTRQVLPYLQGWLALGTIANEKLGLNTPERSLSNGPNFLLVSDNHGVNNTKIMKQIIDEMHIDAVIDSGDELNFGRVQEAKSINLAQGIASLGIPYLMVTGNHDRSSQTDTSLLQDLEKVPNFHALQPSRNMYNLVTVDGVQIGGINDWPRFYGDPIISSKVADAKNAANAKQFSQDTKDYGPIDIAVAHEPPAGENFTNSTLHDYGHTHQASYDGRRNINVGTMSGGDPFNSAIGAAEAAGKLKGCESTNISTADCLNSSLQPSFSILSYDKQCNPTSLMTVNYYIADGKLYQSTIINNAITEKADGKDRYCAVNGSLSTTQVYATTPQQ